MTTAATLPLDDVRAWPAAPGGLLRAAERLPRTGPADPLGPARPDALDHHLARFGPRPRGGAWLIDALDDAGLTGHGGAHVPTALKWRATLRSRGPLTVVANGAESEPIAAKDGTVLRQRPHLVLDGLALAAETLGARRAVVWLHGDDDGGRRALEVALAERSAAHCGGPASRPEPAIEVVNGPVHYLAGEARAVARALAGGPALPTARRPATDPDAPRTMVQNVETLARVALLALGVPSVPTALLTVLTPWDRAVLEVPVETTFAQVLDRAGWPPGTRPSAVLLGGYGGLWARWDDVADRAVHEASLRAVGLTLGAGVVAPLGPGGCGLTETAAIAGYLARMSARQCGPCLFGLPALARSLRLLAAGTAPRGELVRVRDDLRAVEGRGACHHPDGATRLIASALDVFADDVAAHRAGRPCGSAGHFSLPGTEVLR